MSRLSYCANTEEAVYNGIKNNSINSLLEDLKGLINNYNYSYKYNEYWLNVKPFENPKGNQQAFHNLIVNDAQKTKSTIYGETMKQVKMQISVVVKVINEKVENLDDKTKRRVLKKIDTRVSKMIK